MSEADRVELEIEGAVATLTLSGRGGTNAMDLRFVRELDAVTARVTTLVEAGEIAVVRLQARGRHFCVGGDLRDFQAAPDVSEHVATMAGHAHAAIARLHELAVPLVARVHGATAGAGLGLLLAADIVVAARSATFTVAYAAAGLSPDAGVSWAFPRVVGRARAMDALLTNRRLDAAVLQEWGLVSRVVDDDRLDAVVDEVMTAIREKPVEVLIQSKRLMQRSADAALAVHLDDEARTIAMLAGRGEAGDRDR